MDAKSAFLERLRLDEERKAKRFASLVAAEVNNSSVSTKPQEMVSLEDYNKLKEELNRLKSQNTEVYTDYSDKFKAQLEAVEAFINERLRRNVTARILNHDMNYELVTYCRERGINVDTREVKKLLEHFKIPYVPSNSNYYYMGVEFI